MFKSFFPNPRLFFISVVVWLALNMLLWYTGGHSWGEYLGFPKGYAEVELPVGVSRFLSASFIWFYIWFLASTALFAGFWRFFLIINGRNGQFGVQLLSCLISGLACR